MDLRDFVVISVIGEDTVRRFEGLRGHISYRGGHCTWSLVNKLVG